MATAGSRIVAAQVSGERIATNIVTADSATFTTTETTVQSVTAALVTGRTYRVYFYGHCNSSVTTDEIAWRIREDNATGNELQSDQVTAGTATLGRKSVMEAEYTAVATGNKTFVVAGVRQSGTGNCFLEAAATRPAYLYVDYIRG